MTLALLALAFGVAGAQGVRWDDAWPRFGAEEAVVSGVGVAGLSVLSVINPEPKERWDRPFLLDAPAARALGAKEARGARVAARVSDGLVLGLAGLPMVDAAVVGTMGQTNGLSTQWALVGTQSLVLATLSNRVVSTASGRVRPYVARCAHEPDFIDQCDSPDRFRSFFSGHTALAFTGAGLMCANHAYVPMYGGPWDAVACGASMTAATTVATLRIVAHRHYFSDVFVGAAVGAGAGAGLPLILHYRGQRAPEGEGRGAGRLTIPAFTISGRL